MKPDRALVRPNRYLTVYVHVLCTEGFEIPEIVQLLCKQELETTFPKFQCILVHLYTCVGCKPQQNTWDLGLGLEILLVQSLMPQHIPVLLHREKAVMTF